MSPSYSNVVLHSASCESVLEMQTLGPHPRPEQLNHFNKALWFVGAFKLVLWTSNKPVWGLGETSCLDSASNVLWDHEPFWASVSSLHKVEVGLYLWFSGKVWDTLGLAQRSQGLLQKQRGWGRGAQQGRASALRLSPAVPLYLGGGVWDIIDI